ncbi:MAG: aldo/keto reductase [Verrucomicrobiota bacterium]|nr:aldo/keto reductase [Verrucomicrobiota bacterium]
MKYRRFGRTNLQIPVLSCGGMRYQHSWNDTPLGDIPADNQSNLEQTIHRALELGINHIETARGYGSSEVQLAQVLPRVERNKIIVQTKVAPFENPKEFLATFETSMERLNLDYVDLFSLHGINTAEILDWSLKKGGCMDIARQLQKDGRVRHIGFSTHATCDVITKAIESDEFDYVNLHWYFVNHLNWPAVECAARHDMGVFIISPNDKGGKLYAPPEKLVRLCEPLSPMIFNDLYCLSKSGVHTLSIGAAKPSDFDEHIKALEYYDDISTTIASIESKLRKEMDSVLGHDWCAKWDQGIPEYFDIPSQINIKEILRLWTYTKSLNLIDWGKMRYNLLGGAGGHWFPGEMAKEIDNEKIIQACQASPFSEKIPTILREAHELLFDKPVKRLSQSD